MFDLLDLFIYMDEGLVRSLSSSKLEGIIDIRTLKCIRDRTLAGKVNFDEHYQLNNEDRRIRDNTEGYKQSHKICATTEGGTRGQDGSLEDREFERVEEEIKRIYTTFSLHTEMVTSLTNNNYLKDIQSASHITPTNLKSGDYIKVTGSLSTLSLVSYLDTLITLLNNCGLDRLNSIIDENPPGFLNYTGIVGMLSHLLELLTQKETVDMIMFCDDTPILLTTNSASFVNNTSHMYDKVNCPCNVLGKVVKFCEGDECLSLLRKSAQDDFYDAFMKTIEPYLQILVDKGLPLPNKPDVKISGTALMVVPISIYV